MTTGLSRDTRTLKILAMKLNRRIKAQSLAEIAVLLALAVTAFMVMQIYVQRRIQRNVKILTNEIIIKTAPKKLDDTQVKYTADEERSSTKTTSNTVTGVTTLTGGGRQKTIGERTVTNASSYSVDK